MELGLVLALRFSWVLVTLPLIISLIPSSSLNLLHRFVTASSSRGKIWKSSSSTFNNLTVPQRFFLHFYIIGVACTTVLLISTWNYAYNIAPLGYESMDYSSVASHLTGGSHIFALHKSHTSSEEYRYRVWGSVFLLLLMELQVVSRLYETLYVFNYSPSARMHIGGYLTGVLYYVAAPLSLCVFCATDVFNFTIAQVAEFSVKGREMVSIIEYDWLPFVKPLTKLGWWQWIGATVCLWGWVHQRRCHAILGSLRRDRKEKDAYVIPRGDWFETISSAHYLAEFVIYGGLVIGSGGTDVTIWLLFGFVVANLWIVAGETHRWYIQKFEDYPKNRWAILPFIF